MQKMTCKIKDQKPFIFKKISLVECFTKEILNPQIQQLNFEKDLILLDRFVLSTLRSIRLEAQIQLQMYGEYIYSL